MIEMIHSKNINLSRDGQKVILLVAHLITFYYVIAF